MAATFLHTPREYSHLPFERTFGLEYSEYLSKDGLARVHKHWPEFKINIWLPTTVVSGTWDESVTIYTLDIIKDDQPMQTTFRHVLIATGTGWSRKSVIVVGTGKTAHYVAHDMNKAGKQVRMIQRSRTFVLPAEFIKKRYDNLYNDKTITESSARAMLSYLVSIARQLSTKTFQAMARQQLERYAALERAGFKVKSDTAAERYTENGLVFSDGTELKDNFIILATAFVGNLRHHVKTIFEPAVSKKAGDCFGLNNEGKVLRALKPLQLPGLWYISGGLRHARYYYRFISLSIRSDILGNRLPSFQNHIFAAE
ncbi:putative flavin-containing monooxygenase [Fusarium oxysporum II5]|nr:putative flavin-containing monooxygenase [Fusarium oxysporum II5]